MGDAAAAVNYCFDRFSLDLDRGILLMDGCEIAIRPKSFALLHFLLEHAGRVLGHDAIADAVWPGVIASDASIAQCVRDIRRVLGASGQTLLRTVPRRGYVFSGPVHRKQNSAAAVVEPPVTRLPIVAVLSFAPLYGEQTDNQLGLAVAEEIATELCNSRALMVRSYHSYDRGTVALADLVRLIRDTGAQYVLDGSLRQAAGNVRVLARLIDSCSGACLWGRAYSRSIEDIAAVSGELGVSVSWDVAGAINVIEQRQALRGPLEGLSAFQLHQRGLWHLSHGSPAHNDEAAGLFRKAIGLDPFYGAPYAGLALTHFNDGVVYGTRQATQSLEAAVLAVRTAIDLDSDDAESRATYAIIRVGVGQVYDAWDEVTRASLNQAITPWVKGAQGTVQQYIGEPAAGRTILQESLRLAPRDPRNALLLTQVAISYYSEENYAACAEAARRGAIFYPEYPLLQRWLAAALGQLGRIEEAKRALHNARSLSPASFDFYVGQRPAWFHTDQYELLLEGLQKAGLRR